MVADNAAVCGGNILDYGLEPITYRMVKSGQVWKRWNNDRESVDFAILFLSFSLSLYIYIFFFLPFMYYKTISRCKLVVIPEREDNT